MKKEYEKPFVLVRADLFEGVYLASGATAGGISYSVSQTEWGSEYYPVNKYTLTVTNDSDQSVSDWTVHLSISSGTVTKVQIYNGWIASADFSSSQITVKPGGGGAIEAGDSLAIELVVSYSGCKADDVKIK